MCPKNEARNVSHLGKRAATGIFVRERPLGQTTFIYSTLG